MILKEQDFLKIEKLNFSYGKYPILKDITCNIQERKMTAIIGPNGCGKSTLLKNILGFHSGNFESFSLLGKNWKEFSPKDLARVIAYIPQKINIIPGISVRDFICLGRFSQLKHSWDSYSKRDFEIVDNIIETLHLELFRNRLLVSLSGGELQKIFLAKALAQEAKILLLDEPTSALDFHNAIFFMKTLKKYIQYYDITPIIVLHDLNLAASFCDEIIMMKEGKIINKGSPKEMMTVENIHQIYGLDCRVHYSIENEAPYIIPKVKN